MRKHQNIVIRAISIIALAAFAVAQRSAFLQYFEGTIFKDHVQSACPAAQISDNTVRDLQTSIARREYHITYDAERKVHQSPNRQHNLRAYYEPGTLTVRNRKDSVGSNFEFRLVNSGIFADEDRLVMVPGRSTFEQKDNTAEIRYGNVTEQYINNEEGIRQNFIIEHAPAGTKQLKVQLRVQGAAVEDLGDNQLRLLPHNAAGQELTYKDLKCWDAAGAPLIAGMSHHNGLITIVVDAAGATYPVTIDPIVSSGNPSNAIKIPEVNQTQAWLGGSVSSAGDVNGDGYSDVIVAASKYDNGEVDEGAAFIHYGSASGINPAGSVMLQSDQAGARFGCFVSTAGDVNKDGFSDIMVGAHMYDKGQTNEGAVFVYHGSAAGISTNPSLILESNQAEANFGNAMGLAGDVNGDGYSDVVIGARAYDNGQTNEGVAFIYLGSAQGLVNANPVKLEGNQAESMFGFTATGAGDVNGDGYSDVMIGARLFDKGQVDEGAVFIYHGSALGINANAPAIILESNQASAYLGHSLGTAGDVNGDGYSDIVIGANMYDKGQTNEGAAFIHFGSAQGVNANPSQTLEMNQAEAQFGYSVGSAGDVNGDGYADVIVGASYYDIGQTNEGAAFVFHGNKNGLAANPVSTLESNKVGAQFGSSVASAGDINGDGYSDVIVGAIAYDNGHDDEGAVFVWTGGVLNIQNFPDMSDTFHTDQPVRISGAGDVNADGFDDLMVGLPNYDDGGAVFVYYGSASGIDLNSPTAILSVENSGEFGYSVAPAGDVNGDGYGDIIVGDLTYFVKTTPQLEIISGAALVYYGSSAGISTNSPTILASNKGTSLMGWSVASAGDVNGDGLDDVIVGDESYDNGQSDEGAAFVYHGSQSGINPNPSIVLESETSFAQMGYSVSGGGDINGDGFADVIIGAPYYTDGEGQEGAAFIYYGSLNGISKNSVLKLERNQVDAGFGSSVASGGDINGDGFSDVVIGSDKYDNGSFDEGAAMIYYGSSSGLKLTPVILECNRDAANMGRAVAGAIDVNGDGYSDVIVSVPNFAISQSIKGVTQVFLGSSLGITNTSIPAYSLNNVAEIEPYNTSEHNVASAGDLNGDGISDLLVGVNFFNTNNMNERSSITVYYGNKLKDQSINLRNNLRLYNTNLTTPINQTQFAQNNFGAGLYAKSFLGNNKGKMVWETKAVGQAFSKGANNIITNSTQLTAAQNVYTNLGLVGTELKSLVNKQGASTRVRVRVKYDPVLALTGQTYGPWRYLSSQLGGGGVSPAPDESRTEVENKTVATKLPESDQVHVFPNPVSDKLFIQQPKNAAVQSVQLLNAMGKPVFDVPTGEREIDLKHFASGTYHLIVTYRNAGRSWHRIVVKH